MWILALPFRSFRLTKTKFIEYDTLLLIQTRETRCRNMQDWEKQ